MVNRLSNQQMCKTNRDTKLLSDLPARISFQAMQFESLARPIRQFGKSVRDTQQFLPGTGFGFR